MEQTTSGSVPNTTEAYAAATSEGGYEGDTYMPSTAQTKEETAKKKNKEPVRKTVLRIVISLLVIALGIFLILFFVAKASLYDSIGSMLSHMFGELNLMWERIIS
ncbi:hypothetical protein LJC49_07245 [Ruminococcaceae bacterium OttesenSCG-928-I18]|nr:hypothetical protein [Ruminococcaceae bacterium OttesenSCG-928-I18]